MSDFDANATDPDFYLVVEHGVPGNDGLSAAQALFDAQIIEAPTVEAMADWLRSPIAGAQDILIAANAAADHAEVKAEQANSAAVAANAKAAVAETSAEHADQAAAQVQQLIDAIGVQYPLLVDLAATLMPPGGTAVFSNPDNAILIGVML